ncbi:MAG: MBL fold metallo-hydrolase [Acidilobus sp.]
MAEVKVIDVSPGDLKGYISSFVVIDEKVAVIDPGPETGYPKLKAGLEELSVKPDIVVATHVHLDHAGSAAHLMKDFPSAVVYAHPRGVQHVVDPSKLYEASFKVAPILPQTYGRPLTASPERVLAAPDGAVIVLGGSRLRIVHTPGHASHHMSVLLEPEGVLFTGDSAGVIFTVKGREVMLPTTPPPFKPKMYYDSVERMIALKPAKVAPTHFGVHDNALAWLRRAEEQVVSWLKVLRNVTGDDYREAAIEALAKSDADVSLLVSAGEEFMVRGFLENTIDGLIDALRRGEPLPP